MIARALGILLSLASLAAASDGTVTPQVFFPSPGAQGVCPDTPLEITFEAPPTLGSTGKIQIVDAQTNAVVDSIDIRSRTAVKTVGGLANFKYYPVIISGNRVAIYFKNGALAYSKTYYVTVDPGLFGNGFAIDGSNRWRFSTRPAAPDIGATKLTVAADGSGDFCTIQGALDFIPDGNTTPRMILIRKGIYSEIVFVTDKHALTIKGEDRASTIIQYANNDRFNSSSGNPYAAGSNPSTAPRVGGNIYRRAVFLAHRVNDLTISNLTIRNTTPQGGSQAEALILNGTTNARAILKDVDLVSYQDTLQVNGQAYVSRCHISGDVDFMWGTGPCFFENCRCTSLRSGAYYTQVRNPANHHGYVYSHCTFDGAEAVQGDFLSRIEPTRFPFSEVVLLDCMLSDAVGPVAWRLDRPGATPRRGATQPSAAAPDIHFWEFNSRDADGRVIDVSRRSPISRQLHEPEDSALIANYRNPAFVLGNDWTPMAP